MLSGQFQGTLLSIISKLINPKNILEIGTYTGFSALCFAEGLQKDGTLTTIDINEELEEFTQQYFDQSPYKNNIDYKIGNAIDIIPTLNKKFDLVFIDADKENYIEYFNLVSERLNNNGIIISDNVLWSGKVLNTPSKNDEETNILIEFNKTLNKDKRFETIILPLRDGLSISRLI
jgi:predicted O-methyltransferase YrrM